MPPPTQEIETTNESTHKVEEKTQASWDLAEEHVRAAFRIAVKTPRGTRVPPDVEGGQANDNSSSDKYMHPSHSKIQGQKHKPRDETLRKRREDPGGETTIQTISAAAAAQNLAVFLKTKATFIKQSTQTNTDMMEAYMEAKNLYLGSLRVRKALLGDAHPDTVTTKFSLAELLEILGDADGARNLREDILKAYQVSEKDVAS
jgi:hypothetical protein